MLRKCSGCKWISDEINCRDRLMQQFQRAGDYQFARIAQDGIEALILDWRSHLRRDHRTEAKLILALPDAANAQNYDEHSPVFTPPQFPMSPSAANDKRQHPRLRLQLMSFR